MKLSSRKLDRHYSPELELTGMIDVVFLLLVFFIATASFIRTEREMPSSIRFQSTGSSTVNEDLERAVVYVSKNGTQAYYRVGRRTFSDPSTLEAFLAANFRNSPEGAFIYVSDGVAFRWVAAAMHACREAGLESISYVPTQN
ncbi:MAG: biopolymer transport protein ExbD [Pirellulaceae bacterium]|jgi:biopolymer transport protein ExbD